MQVNIHYAKTHLSKLIEQAENGEEVVLARNGKPAVKLTPVPAKKKRSILGAGIGKIWISDDFNSPETNKEIEDLFYNGDGEFFEK
ncbi:MAG TPA: type II toxin-antitoxin system Phd/YefM family antitoxin [Acidobacteriaceae bacterium]|nr:type II toxin-antitoxin system Phd/YefM family antitoxin [Acidobacteriaceae bacterium]